MPEINERQTYPELMKAWFKYKQNNPGGTRSVVDFVAGWNYCLASMRPEEVIVSDAKRIDCFEEVTPKKSTTDYEDGYLMGEYGEKTWKEYGDEEED